MSMCSQADLAAPQSTEAQAYNIDTLIPQTQISRAAYTHATSLLAPSILNHSIRVYLYAKALAQHTSSVYSSDTTKHDLLFTACLFHDIGTTSTYDGPQRFEVEGGDAAVQHLSQYDISESDKHDVWTAISIHTSPGIAERIGELSCIVRIAVVTDFGGKTKDWNVLEPLKVELERGFRRENIEKVLGDAVVKQAKTRPEKAPTVSWPGVMYKAWLDDPKWDGVNKAF